MSKFPSFSQWKQTFKVLKKKEKIALSICLLFAISSFVFLVTNFYITHTKVAPYNGGSYTEGVVGQPRFINPIYGETNDIDRTLIDLVFSGLMNYNKDGELVTDLAQSYKISNDGKTYDFILKDNIFWHDGKPLTSDDIIFTIKTIQNSDYKSPLRANWIDVTVEKISDKSLEFRLKTPYNSFLENVTVKILPKHIWSTIPPENFILSLYNLQPVGSGPYQFTGISQSNTGFIKTLHLQADRRYYNHPAFISNLLFQFFEKEEDLMKSVRAKAIDGFSLALSEKNGGNVEKEIGQGWSQNETFTKYSFFLPRYFAVFFNAASPNQKPPLFSDENVRRGLSYAVNKDELIKKINSGDDISKVDSPILPDFFGYQAPSNPYTFDIEKAKNLLDKSGFKDNGNGVREKAITKKPAFQFKSYLKVGSKGTEVNQLQSCLARLDDTFKNILKDDKNSVYGKATENAVTEFQKKYLSGQNPTGETGKGTRQKLNEVCTPPSPNSIALAFSITTINQPQLLQVANILKDYFQSVGATVTINPVSITDLKPIIKNRNYDVLLYGEALGGEPDLYPFWHSSQRIDPGLNLSSYENKDVDTLLKEARETLDGLAKEQKLEKLQDLILNNAPALFLYNPHYTYFVSGKVQGVDTFKIIDPAKRFSNITNWYIKTTRVWK